MLRRGHKIRFCTYSAYPVGLNIVGNNKDKYMFRKTYCSDCCAAYNALSNEGYTFLSVAHTNIFVDPITYATTNHVEISCKNLIKYRRKSIKYNGYVCHSFRKIMYRQRCNKSHANYLNKSA